MDKRAAMPQGFGGNNGGGSDGNPFAQTTASLCTYLYNIFPCDAAPTATSAGAQASSLQTSASTTADIPEGTGAITTITATAYGFPTVVSGRLQAVSTSVDASGDTVVQEVLLLPGGAALALGYSTLPPSATPTPTASSAITSAPSVTDGASGSAVTGDANSATSPNPELSQDARHTGISTGAIAAAVVVPVVVLALLALLAFFLFRRRKRARQAEADGPYGATSQRSSRAFFFPISILSKKRHDNVREYYNSSSIGSSTIQSTSQPRHSTAALTEKDGASGAVLGSAAMNYAGHQRAAGGQGQSPQISNYTSGWTTPGSDPFGDSHTTFSGFSGAHGNGHSVASTAPPSGAATSNVLSPNMSRRASAAPRPSAAARPSFEEEDVSDTEEYHDAQVTSAAVGVAQRASVINLVSTSPPKHGRLGSTGSSYSSGSK